MMSDLADSSMSIPSAQESRIADKPFNNQAAEVILRTSDKVDFYVSKAILSLASPVFETMFSLPQPVPASDPPKEGDHVAPHPVVDVSEDSLTLNTVLHLCYPVYRPNLKKLKDVGPVLLAARKYDMKVVFMVARTALRQCIQQDVLGVFALAIRCELYGICTKAAKQFLQRPFLSLDSEELDHIMADKYRLLLDYHQRYAADKSFVISRRAWSDRRGLEGQRPSSSPASPTTKHLILPLSASGPRDADAPFDDQTADIILRSSDRVNFHVHSFILSFASHVFKSMILDRQQIPKAETYLSGDEAKLLPIVDVPENSQTLDFVLRLCYPVHLPRLTQLSEARLIFAAGLKYGIDGVKAVVEAAFADLVDQDVIGVWCIALRYKLRDLSTLAARHSVQHPWTSLNSTELSCISARQYHKLLQYHRRCGEAASAVASSRRWFYDLPDGPSTVRRCHGCDVQDQMCGSKWFGPSSLWTFLGAAKGALEVRPCGLTVLSNEVLSKWTVSFCNHSGNGYNSPVVWGDPMRSQNSGCNQVYTRDNTFAQALAKEVDRVVAEVEVPIFF